MKNLLFFVVTLAYAQCNSLSGTLPSVGTSSQVSNTTQLCSNWAVAITTVPPVYNYTANLQGNFGSGFVNIGNTCNTIASCNISYSGTIPNQVQFNVSAFSGGVQGLIQYNITGAVPAGGSGSGGSTVTAAAPYITIGGIGKFVAATMWPFTPFFSGSFLDANTATLTAGANGSETLSCLCNAVNSWYSVAATTSIEAEFAPVIAGTSATNTSVGIWMCDTTNNKLYSWEINVNGSPPTYQEASWNLTGCAGTPASPSVLVTANVMQAGGPYHFQLLKSGGNLLARVSFDGGQTYLQFNSTAVGTLAKAGVSLRGNSGTLTTAGTFLSTVVN